MAKKEVKFYNNFEEARRAEWRHCKPYEKETPIPLKEEKKKPAKKEVVKNG